MGLPIEQDTARIEFMISCNGIKGCAFATTVGAKEAEDFTLVRSKVKVFNREGITVLEADAFKAKKLLLRHRKSSMTK